MATTTKEKIQALKSVPALVHLKRAFAYLQAHPDKQNLAGVLAPSAPFEPFHFPTLIEKIGVEKNWTFDGEKLNYFIDSDDMWDAVTGFHEERKAHIYFYEDADSVGFRFLF